MKKKILLIGPFSVMGGREVEANLIVESLKKNYLISILSTKEFISPKVKSFFYSVKDILSINEIVYKKVFIIRFLTNLICFFKPMQVSNYQRISNKLIRKFVEIKKEKIFKCKIKEYDCIIMCADINSSYVGQLVEYVNILKIPVIFRITGKIDEIHFNNFRYSWVKKVNLFLIHSLSNAIEVRKSNISIRILDQSAFFEKKILKLDFKSKKIKKFLVLSRLSEEKSIDIVIDAFVNIADSEDQLLIYGEGKEYEFLMKKAERAENIFFEGFVDPNIIAKVLNKVDCLIISSFKESGPLTGVEAMASGLPIISTKVGAMPDRLGNYDFFYDGTQSDLERKLINIKRLSEKEIEVLSIDLRKKYLSKYALNIITEQYLDTVNKIIKEGKIK